MKEPQICGVIAILTDPDGRVVATEHDFDLAASGGCGLREGQEYRAKARLKKAVVKAFCSGFFANSMNEYALDVIFRRLLDAGCHVTMIPVGYEDEK